MKVITANTCCLPGRTQRSAPRASHTLPPFRLQSLAKARLRPRSAHSCNPRPYAGWANGF
jgi:hypothetical protein